MIRFSQLLQKDLGSQTAHATPGTRKSIPHGLGYQPALVAISVLELAPANDTANAGVVNIVSADNTNIVVKSNKASQAFILLVALDIPQAPVFASANATS